MTDDLVNDVRLRCVEGNRVVPDVLGRVEDPLCQSSRRTAWSAPDPTTGRNRNPVSARSRSSTSESWGTRVRGQDQPISCIEVRRTGEPPVLGCELSRDDVPDLVLLGACSGRRGSGRLARRRRKPRRSPPAAPRYSWSLKPGMILGEVQVRSVGSERQPSARFSAMADTDATETQISGRSSELLPSLRSIVQAGRSGTATTRRAEDMQDTPPRRNLDEADRRILAELVHDGRMPVNELARRAGVSQGDRLRAVSTGWSQTG